MGKIDYLYTLLSYSVGPCGGQSDIIYFNSIRINLVEECTKEELYNFMSKVINQKRIALFGYFLQFHPDWVIKAYDNPKDLWNDVLKCNDVTMLWDMWETAEVKRITSEYGLYPYELVDPLTDIGKYMSSHQIGTRPRVDVRCVQQNNKEDCEIALPQNADDNVLGDDMPKRCVIM